MKKIQLLAALMVLFSAFSASAEVLTPYQEQFDNASFRPKGWLRAQSSSYSPATYTINKEGGHSGGYLSVNQYSNYYSSYYNNYNYIDVLVTPKVEGEVSLWVRKNGTDPTLTYYAIADIANMPSSASAFTKLADTADNLLKDMDVSDWTKLTVTVPAGTYLGIRAHNLDIDEFTADKAEVLYRPSLIASISSNMSGTRLEADENNLVTFKFKVTIENNGDIDFAASDEGFKVDLVNANLDNKLFGTGNITEAIPCGTTVDKDFVMTGVAEVAEGTTSNNYKVIISHAITNNIEGSLGWFTVVPYAPEPKLMFNEDNDKNQSSYNDVNITDMFAVGAGPAGTSRTMWVWNKGTAEMRVTSVAVTDGFEAPADGFSLAPNEKKSIKVSLTGAPGIKTGSITFAEATLGDLKYEMQGLVTAEGDYAEDFEADAQPEGMVIGKSWNVKAVPDNLTTLAGTKYIENTSTYTPDRFFTPLLSFAEGEKLHFMATKTDNTSSKLTVYTSPDRVNWTAVKTISAAADADVDSRFNVDKPTGSGYGTYEFRIFSADMPAGATYVAFEAGGARIDNIHGGKRVDVSHDMYVVSFGVPDAASVNTRFISNITLRNLLAKAESDYAVVLEIDGSEVARAADTPALAQGEEATFDLRYTPHTEGDFTGKFIFVSGEERMELAAFDFTVGAEKAEAVYQVGDVKITTTDPLQTYYNSQSQIIYRPDQLGMDANVKITGFTFTGYNTKELTKHVKVWIENTDDTAYDPAAVVAADPSGMTLVYEGDYTFKVVGDNNAKVYEPVFAIAFNAPFVYTGKSLRIMIDQRNLTEDADTHNVFFTVDNSVYDYWNDIYDDRVIENKKEYAEDLDDEPSWSIYRAGFPVTYFNVAKDVVVVKGVVTDDFGLPVENAAVKLCSDDILYSATTGADGAYSMNVANVDLVYTHTAEAEGFDTYTAENLTLDAAAEPEAVRDIQLKLTDRTATLSGRVTSSIDDGEPIAGAEVSLKSGEGEFSATTAEDGSYTLTVPEFTDTYALSVAIDGAIYVQEEAFVFASTAETKDFSMAWSSICTVEAATAVAVSVQGRTIVYSGAAGDAVRVFDLAGRLVVEFTADAAGSGSAELPAGMYVVSAPGVACKLALH